MLVRVWGAQQVGVLNGTTIWGNWQFLIKHTIRLPSDPAIPLTGIVPKEIKSTSKQKGVQECLHAQLLSHVWLFVTLRDCSLPGSSVHGIFQARILEWVAFPSPMFREALNHKQSKHSFSRDFLAVQWLRLHAPNAGGPSSIPGQGTKIPQATWCTQNK